MEPFMISLVRELLLEGEEDWVMVDSLIGTAEEYVDVHGGDFKTLSLDLLREILTKQLMNIGNLGETGFEAWSCTVDESVDRFKEGCDAYNWKPMGALWWLANTESGEEWLRSHR